MIFKWENFFLVNSVCSGGGGGGVERRHTRVRRAVGTAVVNRNSATTHITSS